MVEKQPITTNWICEKCGEVRTSKPCLGCVEKKGGQKMFFSYCPECGFEEFGTRGEAAKSAEHHLDHFRDDAAEGGWADETGDICFGVIMGIAVQVPEMTSCEFFGCDDSCDGLHDFDVYTDFTIEKADPE